jgi:ATP-binding cassette, subfamily B, bacterial PglK
VIQVLKETIAMLTADQRRRYFYLQAYFVFAAAIQVLGIASVAPFIALLSNPEAIHSTPLTQKLFLAFDFQSDAAFLMAFAAALAGLIVLTNLVAAVATWLIVSFSLRLGVEIQRDIFRGFLYRDYVDLARTNSGALVAMINTNAPRFIYMVVQPLLVLVSQAIVVLLIVAGLLLYDFGVAVSAGLIIGGGYGVVFTFVRRRLSAAGQVAYEGHTKKQRLLVESLGGIKEIRLLGAEGAYEHRLDAVTVSTSAADTSVGLLGDLPKFVLESIAFCALLGLGVYLLSVAKEPRDIVSFLSLYAMAGYKMLPAAQNVFKSASQIRANASVSRRLHQAILAGRASEPTVEPRSSEDSAAVGNEIIFDDVWFRYPESDNWILRGISFSIKPQSICVIVGASGAGKSTCLDILLGLLRPERGSVTSGRMSIANLARAWQRNVAYVPQKLFIIDDTVAANIAFGARGEPRHDALVHAARAANIYNFIQELPGQFNFVVGENGSLLSGGQRQRIGIARAFYRQADVLVLDEATSALDGITEREILKTLQDAKTRATIVMIAHRLATVQCADQVIFLKDGIVADIGSYSDLIKRNTEFQSLMALADVDRASGPDKSLPVETSTDAD